MLNRNGSHMSTQTASIALPLPADQLATKELVQRLLLPLLAKPQRFAGFQIAHHGQEFTFLAPVQFIDPHVPQRRVPPLRVPSLQVPQIDRPNRAPRQSHASTHLPCRRTLTCQTTASSKRLLNGALDRKSTR